MRRGGGSRGGSFGGGSFGGGGSRSYSRGSSRMYRSSRRHYRHQPYGGRPYYGSRYYGRRYGYYGGGNLIGLLVFLFIFMLIAALAVSAAISSDTTNRYTLAPNSSFEVPYGGFSSSGALSVSVNDGQVQTLVFSSTPTMTGTTAATFSYSENVGADSYEYFGLTLEKTTKVQVDWSASTNVGYYAIKGESNLKSWKNNNQAQFFDDYGTQNTHTFTVTDSDTYFFAIESTNQAATFNLTFLFSLPVYDLSNPVKQYSGSFNAPPSDISGDSVIVHNPSTTDTADVTVVVGSTISFAGTFFLIIGSGALLLFLIYKRNEAKKQNQQQNPSASGQSMPPQSQAVAQPAKPVQQYITRPSAKFCTGCGAGIIEGSKFCTECGTVVA